MTNQQIAQPKPPIPIRREDYKVQKLMRDIESKLTLQGKTVREPIPSSKN